MSDDRWLPLRKLEVITVATTLESPNSTFGPFEVDRFGLAWIIEGGGVSQLDEQVIETSPGTLLLMRPGMVLRHNWGRKRSFQSFIVFDTHGLARGWPPYSDWPVELHLRDDPLFFDLWRQLLTMDHLPQGRSPHTHHLVEFLLRMALQGGTLPPEQTGSSLSEPVERALKLLTSRVARAPEKRLTLGDLCKEAAVTPQHLCRLFQKDLALGPMECFQALKLEQAASRLERTEGTIASIAEDFGFSSQFYFSRAFKKAYGVSPNEYRKKFRVGTATRPGGLIYRHHRLRHYLYENGPGKVLN